MSSIGVKLSGMDKYIEQPSNNEIHLEKSVGETAQQNSLEDNLRFLKEAYLLLI